MADDKDQIVRVVCDCEDRVVLGDENRLRQILPRISRGLGEAGFLQPAEIRIRPIPDKVDFTRPQALGKVRELSETAAAVINKKADSLEESALKDALKDLAATVLKKR